MLGYALGCIHLSYDDFCRLTPDEFNSVCRAYGDQEQAQYKDNWERMRILAAITIQPHVKSKLTPQKLLPLSWDSKRPHTRQQAEQVESEHITAKEAKERKKKIIALLGDKY